MQGEAVMASPFQFYLLTLADVCARLRCFALKKISTHDTISLVG